MINQKINPDLIRKTNLKLPYEGGHRSNEIDINRDINFPEKLRETLLKRGQIFGNISLKCCEINETGYHFLAIWDYNPYFPEKSQRKWYGLSVSEGAMRLILPKELEIKSGERTFLGMIGHIELWNRIDLKNYLESKLISHTKSSS